MNEYLEVLDDEIEGISDAELLRRINFRVGQIRHILDGLLSHENDR